MSRSANDATRLAGKHRAGRWTTEKFWSSDGAAGKQWTAIALHSSKADVTGGPRGPSVVVNTWDAFGEQAGLCCFSRGVNWVCPGDWTGARSGGGG
jgi:hypothetical protein